MTKTTISKEDFKRYLTGCPKKAWAFYDLENFKKVVSLVKNKKIIIHLNDSFDSEEDFNDQNAINIIELYSDLIDIDESQLSEEKKQQKKLLLEQLESVNGFDISMINNEAIRDGKEFGQAAREYIIEKLYQENNQNNTNYLYLDLKNEFFESSLSKTKIALQDSQIKYLFEPAFEVDNQFLKIRCDTLINNGNNHVSLIEFKASTKCKLEHFIDILYQKWVLEKNNLIVDNIYVGLLNNNYIRGEKRDKDSHFSSLDSQEVDLDKLNKVLNEKPKIKSNISDLDYQKLIRLTDQVEQYTVPFDFEDLFIAWENSNIKFEDLILEMKAHFACEDNLFNDNCWKFRFNKRENKFEKKQKACYHIVNYYDQEKYNLFELTRFKSKAIMVQLRNKDKIYIENIKDFNEKVFIDFDKSIFNKNTKRIIDCVQQYIKSKKFNPIYIIDLENYAVLLDLLKDYWKFPVYMYDFETVKWAIPKYDHSYSYMQVPFQYSIHTIMNSDFDFKDPNKNMNHDSFISETINDPRIEFIKNFVNDCFKYGRGVYVAYNKCFERNIIKNLIAFFPEYKEPLLYVYQNTIDLMDFFYRKNKNWLIYHPDFRGSYSIKKTQPALDASLNYNDLKINKGDKTSEIFRQYLDELISQDQFEVLLKNDMLDYCNRDTLAMVVVLQKVIEIVKSYDKDFESKIYKLLEEEKGWKK